MTPYTFGSYLLRAWVHRGCHSGDDEQVVFCVADFGLSINFRAVQFDHLLTSLGVCVALEFGFK